MITRVAVVPYPPLLVPALTVRADAETERLRGACSRAVSSLADSSAEWVVVGVDQSGPTRFSPDTAGTFAGFGRDVRVSLGGAQDPDPHLPLPVLIAGLLREQAGARTAEVRLLAPGTPVDECADVGSELAGRDAALLVLAEGSNRADERSSRAPDPRARPLDDRLARALAEVDTDALRALDPELCAELGVPRAALQVLPGVVEEGTWRGELLHSATPFGVTYHVATWTRED
ncbi:hypothetical protein EIL87_19210 [Saccharopolyspora rhizosphaerae]|uniref:Extradiol ring-cleavage dioxygenase class III enzyme subunit B domain-containing protein n=1 Tax=Saccharopolyspora rhizosphaerae TaxID=2492662 RepID=A0A426JP47_9PSEU|nr:hypothetical protein [Saccharopolyspora rhizosphaerae]RRO14855.1 hypothetical protein EIL87_19210 [Saccharopolyspora rhizosphaerae]